MQNPIKCSESKDLLEAWAKRFAQEMVAEANRLAASQASRWVFIYWL